MMLTSIVLASGNAGKIKEFDAFTSTCNGTNGAQIRRESEALSKKEHQEHHGRNDDSGEPPWPRLH